MRRSARIGLPGWAIALAVLVLAGLALIRPGPARAEDPEPKLVTDLPYDIDPGPGWPPGWTPPPPPTEIPQGIIDAWELEKSLPGADAAKRLEMRVMPFLPDWTKEYPYLWHFVSFRCGDTQYIYFYPYPDRELLQKTYGDGYWSALGGYGGEDCTFAPIVVIKSAKRTPEEEEQLRMDGYLARDFAYARLGDESERGLSDCHNAYRNGTKDNIYVCFNNGEASSRFDAPAYLDTTVNRVRVPLRFVSEMMRAEVKWDHARKTVTIHFPRFEREMARPVSLPGYQPSDWIDPDSYGWSGDRFKLTLQTVVLEERTIVLTVGKNEALVNGRAVPLDAPPVIVPPGRVMVPIRFISEVLGAKVYWVGSKPIFRTATGGTDGTYQVHIYTPLFPFYDFPDWFLEKRAQKS